MSKVIELKPGDMFHMPRLFGKEELPAVFVTSFAHPQYIHLVAVVWLYPKGLPPLMDSQPPYHTIDALNPMQDVGEIVEQTEEERFQTLQTALTLVTAR